MNELPVIVLGIDEEQRAILQMQLEGTGVATVVHTFGAYPLAGADPVFRRIRDSKCELVVLDIPKHETAAALRAIELLHNECPGLAMFAVGETSQPQTIIAAMRSGAREFLDRPTSTTQLLDALIRFTSSKTKKNANKAQGKVFTVVNAKGGSGATTIAVNLAIALQSLNASTALVDLAPLGHAAIHLNVRPTFTVADAIRNAHRMDPTLLEGYMTRCDSGLHLFAGVSAHTNEELVPTDLARFFDVLVHRYQSVVVDASTRVDHSTRLVADLSDAVMLVTTADVPGLWSAERVRNYFADGPCREQIGLVLNRFRKIPGMNDDEIQASTRAKVLFKLPNNYLSVAESINRGVPVTTTNHSELARSFQSLAKLLMGAGASQGKHFSLF